MKGKLPLRLPASGSHGFRAWLQYLVTGLFYCAQAGTETLGLLCSACSLTIARDGPGYGGWLRMRLETCTLGRHHDGSLGETDLYHGDLRERVGQCDGLKEIIVINSYVRIG